MLRLTEISCYETLIKEMVISFKPFSGRKFVIVTPIFGRNFRQKSKFSSKIEIFAQKSQFSS